MNKTTLLREALHVRGYSRATSREPQGDPLFADWECWVISPTHARRLDGPGNWIWVNGISGVIRWSSFRCGKVLPIAMRRSLQQEGREAHEREARTRAKAARRATPQGLGL